MLTSVSIIILKRACTAVATTTASNTAMTMATTTGIATTLTASPVVNTVATFIWLVDII
ncbi:hypothetical protein INT45_013766, partial [Circinella minor]